MNTTQEITVITKPRGNVWLFTKQFIIWSYLVLAEGVAHWWFGGSWIIDLMVLISLVGILSLKVLGMTGRGVVMTKDEIRAWVQSGMPDNVVEWRASERAVEVRR